MILRNGKIYDAPENVNPTEIFAMVDGMKDTMTQEEYKNVLLKACDTYMWNRQDVSHILIGFGLVQRLLPLVGDHPNFVKTIREACVRVRGQLKEQKFPRHERRHAVDLENLITALEQELI